MEINAKVTKIVAPICSPPPTSPARSSSPDPPSTWVLTSPRLLITQGGTSSQPPAPPPSPAGTAGEGAVGAEDGTTTSQRRGRPRSKSAATAKTDKRGQISFKKTLIAMLAQLEQQKRRQTSSGSGALRHGPETAHGTEETATEESVAASTDEENG